MQRPSVPQESSPLVSVVIAAYQQPDYLNAALESVAAQTHAPVEIIVADDASGPEYTARYRLPQNAALLVHPVRRATAAITRNTGLRAARGHYIAFLDQDDLWEPDKLARQVALLEAHPAAVLTFCHYARLPADTPIATTRPDPKAPRLARDPVRQFLIRNTVHCPSQVLLRRSALDRMGLFDETIRGAADWDFWLRAAAAGPLLADPAPLVRYRVHAGQWSRQSVMMCRGAVAVMEKAAGWLAAQRPDLAGLIRRRRARWLRELARVQLETGQPTHETLPLLRQAWAARPWDLKALRLLFRARRLARSIPTTPLVSESTRAS